MVNNVFAKIKSKIRKSDININNDSMILGESFAEHSSLAKVSQMG